MLRCCRSRALKPQRASRKYPPKDLDVGQPCWVFGQGYGASPIVSSYGAHAVLAAQVPFCDEEKKALPSYLGCPPDPSIHPTRPITSRIERLWANQRPTRYVTGPVAFNVSRLACWATRPVGPVIPLNADTTTLSVHTGNPDGLTSSITNGHLQQTVPRGCPSLLRTDSSSFAAGSLQLRISEPHA